VLQPLRAVVELRVGLQQDKAKSRPPQKRGEEKKEGTATMTRKAITRNCEKVSRVQKAASDPKTGSGELKASPAEECTMAAPPLLLLNGATVIWEHQHAQQRWMETC